jgi:hypothetical protein
MSITPLPPAPSRTDPATFSDKADTFVVALPVFVTETNALAVDVTNKQGQAAASATASQNSAVSSATSANQSQQSASQAEGFRNQAETFKDGAETAAAAAGSAAGLPSLAGKNGYVLSVSQDGTTVEWAPPQMGAAETFILSM